MVSSYLLIFVYAFIIFWIFSFIFFYRKQITCMTGMMIAMTIGMALGLTVGTLLGLLYPDQFFQMTVVGILIGGILGVIAGLPFSIMAVLDGFLSGAMGGMMGAMLGVMITTEAINATFNVMVILSGGILFILFLMIQSEVKFKENDWKNKFFFHRLPLFLVILFAFYLTHHYSITTTNNEIEHYQNINESTEKDLHEDRHDH